MQISRHWRMNSQRYRLEGVRFQNGAVSLQARPTVIVVEVVQPETRTAPPARAEVVTTR